MNDDNFKLETPVLLIMFNRPNFARQVFEKIRQARPSKFFIASNAPRADIPGEAEKVEQCRALKDLVDWECEVYIDFAKVHMSLKDRISSVITWAFENVEELIILEDDCVPDLTFFRFCQEMLEKYRNDNRVMSISGSNHDDCERFNESYAFSKSFGCWGWATWKRSWISYDLSMKNWPMFQNTYIRNVLNKEERLHLENELQLTFEGKINSWAYPCVLHHFINHSLCIVPKVNLVRNIGFENGVHTSKPTIQHLYMDEKMDFPLIHPVIMSPNEYHNASEQQNISNIGGGAELMLLRDRIGQNVRETNYEFEQMLKYKQYHAVLILFNIMLRKKDTFLNPPYYPLSPHHIQYVYYAAYAYFMIGDYEHAVAMLNVILCFESKNVKVLILLVHTLIGLRSFNEANKIFSFMKELEISPQDKVEIENIDKLLKSVSN